MVRMSGGGSYDVELAWFLACAFDAYLNPKLALDVANFRLAHGDMLHHLKEATATIGTNANQLACAKAKLDVERKAFVEAAKNKDTNKTWVETYHKLQQQTGWTFEDENRWAQVLPIADVHVDWFPGEKLIYMPHGSSYVDEMILGNTPIKNTKLDACMSDDFFDLIPAQVWSTNAAMYHLGYSCCFAPFFYRNVEFNLVFVLLPIFSPCTIF
ncbi:unnamed protein product [Miscanthus lutarioriparius]|uniref:Uncharacterized protein n=1 Tax=Miscanthus lutarioriparius TaxID=422564 RepID=A0A811MIM6_9POAL|nr:unnamed protein product [Miscanthus lutarioriparius]